MPAFLTHFHAIRRFTALLLVLPLLAHAGAARAAAVGARAPGGPRPALFNSYTHRSPGSLPRSAPTAARSFSYTHIAAQEPTPTFNPTPNPTPLPSETPASQRRPPRTPGPTSTPPTIPPPQDPGTTQLMVAFGLLVVLVILFGVWLNRNRAGS